MEAIMFILVVLAYCFVLKLIEYGISRGVTGTGNMHSKNKSELNQSEHASVIKTTSQKPTDDTYPESGETVTLPYTDRESFDKEWEIIDDDDDERTTH